MKVTLVGPVFPYRGGIAHYNASLAQALTAAGHSVQLISFRRQYPARLYPGESDKDPSTEPICFPADYLLDPLFPWTWLHSARTIIRNKPDLIVFHWWTTFWAPAYTSLARLVRKQTKVVFLIHNVLPHEAKVWDRWMARTAFHQAKVFIVQAPHERERLYTLISKSSQVVESSHPAYRPFSLEPILKKTARQVLGLPENQPILLFFGIVRPYKGLKYLIEALTRVQQPVTLVVAGEFWEDISTYQKLINTLDLSQKVTFINKYIPNEEAHQLFSAVDGLIAPYVGGTQSGAAGLALGYGLPMVITERVAAGLPTGYITSSPNESGTFNNGYAQVVPSADPIALAIAIDKLLNMLPLPAAVHFPVAEDWARLVNVFEDIAREES